jgi:hypothetical protein
MRKAAIIAIVAVGSSLALYAGINLPAAKNQKAETECCNKPGTCPKDIKENCCSYEKD